MTWLDYILNKEQKLAIGLMSGTSMDGIDTALVKIKGSGLDAEVQVVDFVCESFSPATKEVLINLNRSVSYEEVSDLNFRLGEELSNAVKKIIKKNGLNIPDVDFIGSHGQTVYHNPPSMKKEINSTCQIGEADVISAQTGITTVSDFRKKDIACGGEGAPFIPYVDYVLFKKLKGNVIAQNIGGIANCTFVGSKWDDVIAFDSGPGNSLIDAVVSISTSANEAFDNNGEIASRGSVNKDLLNRLLKHPYLELSLPKSTGKELFGIKMAEEIYKFSLTEEIKLCDLLCTLVEFTVETVVSSYERFIFPLHNVDEVVVSGGGAFNGFMMDRFKSRLSGCRVEFSGKYGIAEDSKEAVGFALFANETLHGNLTGIGKVTGAESDEVPGKISIGRNNLTNV